MQTMTPPTALAQPQYEITDADKARQQRIVAAWQAYDGMLDKPLQKMDGQPDDNVLSNRMQAVVDRGIDFLFGKELEISVEESAPQEAQELLDDVWGRKEARIPLLQKLAMNGAMAGQAFLRIVPNRDGSFRLVVLDPATAYVQTAPQDCETVLLYCIEYCTVSQFNGRPSRIYYREEIKRIDPDAEQDTDGYADTNADGIDPDNIWQIQHWSRIGEKDNWTAAGDPIIWNYPFPPLFGRQNLPRPNDYWGQPDITPDLIGINQALNLVQSNINRILKLYGSPILYATGTGEGTIDIKPGCIIKLPLSESKIVAVTLASDIANALSFAADLRSDIDEQSGVPGVATGRLKDLPRGQLSGVTIELLHSALLKKTDKKRCLYGELIIEVSKAILVLAGFSADINISLAWQSPLPHDDLASLQAAVLKKSIGISDTSIQRELGYDPDEELALSQTEDAQKLANFSRGQGMPPAPAQGQIAGNSGTSTPQSNTMQQEATNG
jgi:hypothetical protein